MCLFVHLLHVYLCVYVCAALVVYHPKAIVYSVRRSTTGSIACSSCPTSSSSSCSPTSIWVRSGLLELPFVPWHRTMPIRFPERTLYSLFPLAVETTSFLFHAVLPIYLHGWRTGMLLTLLHFTLSGFLYFLIVSPNHDTDATLKSSREALGDWGEHQVLHSSNSHSSKC